MDITPRERMRRAVATGTDPGAALPDRVPVMCQLALGHYFLRAGLPAFDVWYTSEGFAEALVRLAERYRFDGILVNLPGREKDLGARVDRVEKGKREDVIRWKEGGYSVLPHDDNPHYFLDDGTRYFPPFEAVDPETLFYVEPWDVTDITYPFTWGFEEEPRPSGDFFPPYHFDALKSVIARVGGRLAVHSEVFSPFSQLLELLNYEAALLAIIDDPGKVHRCLERLTAGAIDLVSRQAACGVDAVLISSAFAGAGLISREHYQGFVQPYEEKLIAEARRRLPDLVIYTHTCGSIGDRLDLMLATGTRGVDTLDPPPLGTVDLAEAKGLLRGKAFIKGNIDPVNTMLLSGPEEVRADALRRLEVGMPGGGYILSTACSVAPVTTPENLSVLAQVAEEHGKY